MVPGGDRRHEGRSRAVRLRITCDTKYPGLIIRICSSLRQLLPQNKVSLVGSRGNYVNISVRHAATFQAPGASKQSWPGS
jgi:hypothetical protein